MKMEDVTHVAFESTTTSGARNVGPFPGSMTKVQDATENDQYHLYQTISLLELKIKIIADFIRQKFGFDIDQLLKMHLNLTPNYDHATGLLITKQDPSDESPNNLVQCLNPLSNNNNNNSPTTTAAAIDNRYQPPSPPRFTNFYPTAAINNNNNNNDDDENVGAVEPYNLNNQNNQVMNTNYNLTSNGNNRGKIKTIVTFNNSKMSAGDNSSPMVKKRKLNDIESNYIPPENQEEENTDEELINSTDKNHENNFEEPNTNINMECLLPGQEISVHENLEFTTVDIPIKMEVEMVEGSSPIENGNNNNNIHTSTSENLIEQEQLSETSTTTITPESINQNSVTQEDVFLSSPTETHEHQNEQNKEHDLPQTPQCDSDPNSYTNPFAKFVTTKGGNVVQIIHENDPDIDIKYGDIWREEDQEDVNVEPNHSHINTFDQYYDESVEEGEIMNDNDNDDFDNTEENNEQNSTENYNQQQVLTENEEEESLHSNHCNDENVEMDRNSGEDTVNTTTVTQQQQQQISGDEQVQIEREIVNQEFEIDEAILEVEEAAPELDLEELQTTKSFKQPIRKRNQEPQEVILHQFIQQERSNNNRQRPLLPRIPINPPLPKMSSFEILVRSLVKTHAAFQTFFDFLWILNIKAYQPDKLPFLLLIKRDDIRSWFEYIPNERDLAFSTYRCRICYKHNPDPTNRRTQIETDEGVLKETANENRSCISYHSKQKSHKNIVAQLMANSDPDALVIKLEKNLKKELHDALKETVEPATRLRIP